MCLARSARLSCLTNLVNGVILFSLPACASVERPKSGISAPVTKPRVAVGEIAFVNSEEHFVLIDLESNLYVPLPGTQLVSVSSKGKTTRLKAGAEQKRPFVAADILEGTPTVGDRVER